MNYLAFAVQNARRQFQPPDFDAAIQADADEMDNQVAVPISDGPRQCCADAGRVIACTGEIDSWECWICSRVWVAPCK